METLALESLFNKVTGLRPASTQVFFYRTPPDDCFWNFSFFVVVVVYWMKRGVFHFWTCLVTAFESDEYNEFWIWKTILWEINDAVVAAWEHINDAVVAAWEHINDAVVAAWKHINDAAVAAWEHINDAVVAAWEHTFIRDNTWNLEEFLDWLTFGSKYSRMDLVKFVEDSL